MNRKLYLILFFLILGILSSVFIALPVLADTPTITSISPNSGPIGGGTSVTITGMGFVDEGVTSVTIGGIDVSSFLVTSDTSLTTTTPSPRCWPR